VDTMSSSAKMFIKQSGQMQAVREELQEVLVATQEVVEKIRSDPPPSLHPHGFYQVSPGDDGIERVEVDAPFLNPGQMPKLRGPVKR
jgi:hypothetical protein